MDSRKVYETNFVPRTPEAVNEVFKSPTIAKEVKPQEVEQISLDASSTSIETVSEHFRTLFQQLEGFMKTSSKADADFVHRRMAEMKDGMNTINNLFDDVLNMGIRLEKFLEERQMDFNNNNVENNGEKYD
jgi:hypothetical protein